MAGKMVETGKVVNVVVAGLGGQGVLKASDILAEVVFEAGYDVKKSELHGMSQRGGSVSSDVRFGREVFSPMIPQGEADYLLVLEPTQVENNKQKLSEDGVLITADVVNQEKLSNKKTINIALLGVLSGYLDIDEGKWLDVIYANLPEKFHEVNKEAFLLGRAAGNK